MNADLHIHSKESDGCLTVEEILLTASERGLDLLAITDHETTLGVEKAQKIAPAYGIEIIPGLELNTVYKDEEIHLLGYYKNIHNDQLQEKLFRIRKDRTDITRNMVKKLCQQGIVIEWEDVEQAASSEGVICKTHIMYAIRKKSMMTGGVDWNEVASWFRPGGVAYIAYHGHSYTDAVDFIFATGGLPVLAHPGLIKNKSLVAELLQYRRIGLEVYYGYWAKQAQTISFFENLSDRAVLSTGGSDYHGFFSPVGIGQIAVPERCVIDLKNYLQIGERMTL